jgi:hypothetical protein
MRVLALVALCLLGASALAEESADSEAAGGYLTFYLDNDLFGGTDRNYTNGARLSWISEGEPLLDSPAPPATTP